MISYRRTLT